MKKAIIGGFFALVGSIWTLSILIAAGCNLTSAWTTPPGRLLSTVIEIGATLPFVLSVLLLIVGIGIMLKAYFQKED